MKLNAASEDDPDHLARVRRAPPFAGGPGARLHRTMIDELGSGARRDHRLTTPSASSPNAGSQGELPPARDPRTTARGRHRP